MKIKTDLAEKATKKYRYDEAEPVSKEIQGMYTWGVFMNGKQFIANTYYQDQNYPSLVKGNLSKADAEKLAAEKNAK